MNFKSYSYDLLILKKIKFAKNYCTNYSIINNHGNGALWRSVQISFNLLKTKYRILFLN